MISNLAKKEAKEDEKSMQKQTLKNNWNLSELQKEVRRLFIKAHGDLIARHRVHRC